MFHNILCAIDSSPSSAQAAQVAAQLARDLGAKLVLAHACYTPPIGLAYEAQLSADLVNEIVDDAKHCLDKAAAAATAVGARSVTTKLVHGAAWAAVIHVAREMNADLIVVGTHGRSGISRFLLGSVAENIVRHATCSVLVARGEVSSFRHVLCPVDFSPSSQAALLRAAEIATESITLMHAVELPLWYGGTPQSSVVFDDLEVRARTELERWRQELATTARVNVTARTRVGMPAEKIVAMLDDHREHDLVVIGSHGRTGVRRLLLGSVAERVVRHAPCSVLVARSHDATA